jgi:primary-amine oxidase
VSITIVTPNCTITIKAGGFRIHETVIIVIHSDPVTLATVPADSNGQISTAVTIPANIPAGQHTITATGMTSGHTVTFPIAVAAPGTANGGGLSNTGVAAIAAGGSSVLLIAGGAFFVLAARNNKQAH